MRSSPATGILSTRLVWFEHGPAGGLAPPGPRHGHHPRPPDPRRHVPRGRPARARCGTQLEQLVARPADRPYAEVAEEIHRRLGASPAALAAATLEDLLGVVDRPNLPGTLDDERPNWSVALPMPIEALRDRPRRRFARWRRWPTADRSRPEPDDPCVPGAGFEPASPLGQRCLRPPCMPFHHPGVEADRTPTPRSGPGFTTGHGITRGELVPIVKRGASAPGRTPNARLHLPRPRIPAARHGPAVGRPPVLGDRRRRLGGQRARRRRPAPRRRRRRAPPHRERPALHLRAEPRRARRRSAPSACAARSPPATASASTAP